MIRIFAILGCSALLAGCGTVDGIGQDISAGARTVERWF
jgi:predicted small secreted protein